MSAKHAPGHTGWAIIPLLLLLGLMATPVAVHAQPPDDAEAIGAFVDPIFAEHMDEFAIPGAAVVMVRDGEIVYSRGYGETEHGGGAPVVPERTIFDVGSVSKLFTATAVMQQVERGILDLDVDVNEYLTDFQIPDTYDEPITLRHLMTHTPGFDDRLYLGMVAPGPDEIHPLSENLREHLPPRIRKPGEVNQYSNAGMTLAGHIVEIVSGQTFAEYVQANIFDPLGMDRSTYDWPEALRADMATGHESMPGPATPVEVWHLNQRPAGGLRTTMDDIAQFMIAHLDDGGMLLDPGTISEMHQEQFRAHHGISGSTIGFIEHRVGDRRGLHHGGQWIGFSSVMYLLPEQNTGFFASYNHGSAIFAQYDLLERLLDEYFPAGDVSSAQSEAAATATVAGDWRWNRVDRHTFLQLLSMLTTPTLSVNENGDGTINSTMSPALYPDATWEAIGDGVYREIDGSNRLAFDFDENGTATAAHIAWPLLMTMERVEWYQSTALNAGLLGFFLLVLASTIVWPLRRLYRRIRGGETKLDQAYGRARLIAGLVSIMVFAFLVGTVLLVAIDTPGFFQVPLAFKVLLWLLILAAVLTIPLVIFVVRLWLSGATTIGRRVHLSVIAVAMLGLIPFLSAWGLLGFNY